ncbi:MAG: ATP-dependent DNA helicase [Lysobacterales bacterium]
MDQLLGPNGDLDLAWPQYRPREGQRQLAAEISAAIESASPLIAEAGTGIGKTYAYLLPALVSGQRVVVSTGTRTLQDQLYQRDIPNLLAALELTPRIALLKGRSNYLCLQRMDNAAESGIVDSPELYSLLSKVRSWADQTRDGELSGAHFLPETSKLRPQVSSTVDNCLGGECPRYGDCHVIKARRRAQEADLVVVNHHLLFADLSLKQEGFGELLPECDVIVVDEAHQVPDVASRFFGRGFTYRQLSELTRDCRTEAGGEAGVLPAVTDVLANVDGAARRLRLALATSGNQLGSRGPWQEARRRGSVEQELVAVVQILSELSQTLKPLAPASAGLESVWGRCQRVHSAAQAFLNDEDADHVCWFETSRLGFQLQRTPLNLSQALGSIREAAAPCWIYTSATLSVGGKFALFQTQLGLEEAATVSIESPFDFPNRALLFHPPALPEPSAPGFVPAFVAALLPLLQITGGRAFLLFTSHRNLQQARTLLGHAMDLPIFVQGDAPRHQLLEDFRQSGNGVLLGAASFWAGVDVPGDALSCVAVDKLPFAAPDDPVVQARMNRMRADGEQPFGKFQLPSAVLTLKQGVGRLLRHENDRGVIVIGDPRLTSKGYGKVFLNSLPPARYTQELSEVRAFFQHNESDDDA